MLAGEASQIKKISANSVGMTLSGAAHCSVCPIVRGVQIQSPMPGERIAMQGDVWLTKMLPLSDICISKT